MTKFEEIKAILRNENHLVEAVNQLDDNLIVEISETLKLTFYEYKNTLDLYINEYYFGNLFQQNLTIIIRELLKDNKTFIQFRKPRGIKKTYFKIEVDEEYQKNESKYLAYRGIKIFTKDKVILDRY
jgi:hypothetical protein